MTTAEAAADVQVPDIGEHPSPVDGDGAPQAPEVFEAPTTFTFIPSIPEFGPPVGVPPVRPPVDYGAPIVVPKTSVIVSAGTERWFFRQLNRVQQRIEERNGSQLELA